MPVPDAARHLYVHVPFCRRRCSYCDFAIAVRRRIPAADYVDAMRREISLLGGAGGPVATLETVYLGGGTPSLLPAAAVQDVLDAVDRRWGIAPHAEVTLEANPEDVEPEAASAWVTAGVTRVSLGVQSFHAPALTWMHRPHRPEQPARAMGALRQAGCANVSLDLIFGLPRALGRDWRRDLEAAIALDPDHLSLYGLTVEPRTPLARWVGRQATVIPADEDYAAEYLVSHAVLGLAGYTFYEVSSAAREGRRSRHNLAYWSNRPYVGLGPASHSYDGVERRWNLAAWVAYRQAVLAGHQPVAGRESLDAEKRRLERVYLSLRTADGVAVREVERAPVRRWCEAGWAVVRGDRLVMTLEGWLRLDALALDLTDCQVSA